MRSGTDRFLEERTKMAALRKAAGLPTQLVRATENVGHGVWRGAKAIGGGEVGGAAVLAGTGVAASATVPQMVHAARDTYSTVSNPQAALARGGMK